jgi:hypothetical protein
MLQDGVNRHDSGRGHPGLGTEAIDEEADRLIVPAAPQAIVLIRTIVYCRPVNRHGLKFSPIFS